MNITSLFDARRWFSRRDSTPVAPEPTLIELARKAMIEIPKSSRYREAQRNLQQKYRDIEDLKTSIEWRHKDIAPARRCDEDWIVEMHIDRMNDELKSSLSELESLKAQARHIAQEDSKLVREAIVSEREKRGMTAQQLADKIGVGLMTIERIEREGLAFPLNIAVQCIVSLFEMDEKSLYYRNVS